MVIDQDMWLKIMEEYKMCVINDYLINYRIHLGQGSMILNRRRKTLSPEYKLYDEYIEKWKFNNIDIIKRYNIMKATAYLFYALNCLLEKDKQQMNYNMNYSYFYCYKLSGIDGVIRWALKTFPHFFMRYNILCTVKLLKLMWLNRKYLFINYI